MMRGSKAARLRPRFPRIVWSCSNWWNERAGVALAGGIPSPALHPNPQRLTLALEALEGSARSGFGPVAVRASGWVSALNLPPRRGNGFRFGRSFVSTLHCQDRMIGVEGKRV